MLNFNGLTETGCHQFARLQNIAQLSKKDKCVQCDVKRSFFLKSVLIINES